MARLRRLERRQKNTPVIMPMSTTAPPTAPPAIASALGRLAGGLDVGWLVADVVGIGLIPDRD